MVEEERKKRKKTRQKYIEPINQITCINGLLFYLKGIKHEIIDLSSGMNDSLSTFCSKGKCAQI